MADVDILDEDVGIVDVGAADDGTTPVAEESAFSSIYCPGSRCLDPFDNSAHRWVKPILSPTSNPLLPAISLIPRFTAVAVRDVNSSSNSHLNVCSIWAFGCFANGDLNSPIFLRVVELENGAWLLLFDDMGKMLLKLDDLVVRRGCTPKLVCLNEMVAEEYLENGEMVADLVDVYDLVFITWPEPAQFQHDKLTPPTESVSCLTARGLAALIPLHPCLISLLHTIETSLTAYRQFGAFDYFAAKHLKPLVNMMPLRDRLVFNKFFKEVSKPELDAFTDKEMVHVCRVLAKKLKRIPTMKAERVSELFVLYTMARLIFRNVVAPPASFR